MLPPDIGAKAKLPVLELRHQPAAADGSHQVDYRWNASEPGFDMPVRVGSPNDWQVLSPTAEWQSLTTPLSTDEFAVATDLYYIEVKRVD